MKQIKLLSMHIQNFKGCKDRTIEFGEKTRISGANATGKTTIFDAFTWLLFGKDSLGSSDFEIRPLDIDGNMINNIEISVEAKISVDCDEYDLKKVQKQKWVKKRGTNTREFQGKSAGYEVLHFSGSQIYEDPWKCAEQTISFILEKLGKLTEVDECQET